MRDGGGGPLQLSNLTLPGSLLPEVTPNVASTMADKASDRNQAIQEAYTYQRGDIVRVHSSCEDIMHSIENLMRTDFSEH